MAWWREFSTYCASWCTGAIILRLVAAFGVGITIGVDRGIKRRGAGIKTHTLVCLGAAIVMLTGQFIYITSGGANSIDRLGAQVISGVGFLGVGTILVTDHNRVRGLTTAASLWICACLGLAAGIGFVDGVLLALALVLVTLKILSRVDDAVHKRARMVELCLVFETPRGASDFVRQMHRMQVHISNFELVKSIRQEDCAAAVATVELSRSMTHSRLLDALRAADYLRCVEEV